MNTGCNSEIKENVKSSVAAKFYANAETFRKDNKFKEAVDNYLHSILSDRTNFESYLGLVYAYKELRKYDKAIKVLEKMDLLKPDDATVQKESALCNVIVGNFDKGMKYLRKAILKSPDDIELQMQLAMVHQLIEEEEMAIKIYNKIIERNPDYIRAYIQKATLYMHLEDYRNCAQTFKKVIELDKNYYRGYIAIGICCEKTGNFRIADRYYKKYLKLCEGNVDFFDIKYRISELKIRTKRTDQTLRVL